jgi:pimeloyl-ACP methyl ester carboxylesterase
VPVGVLVAEGSPIPPAASQATVERIPGAWLQLEPQVGHFLWLERPGLVRAALDRLARTTAAT